MPWNPQPFSHTADVQRVLEEFEAGATIVLQGLHYNWRPLAELCRGLEAALGHPAQANAYYTPRGSQGLPVHHDTHDVFVLQVAGNKRWQVYDPVLELPLREQRYQAELGAPGDPVQDLTLAAGDVLYLPRGWMHEALTSDADSLHVTVGVNVYSWIDAVRAAVDSCAGDIEFRRSVPVDGEQSTDLLERVRERLSASDVSRRMRSRLVRSRRPILGGQLGQLRALDDLGADTELVRRPTVIADLEQGRDGAVALVFEGKRVSFPAQAEEAVAFVATADRDFRPVDLPGDLDEAGRLVLVRRLVREGFLLVKTTPPDASAARSAADGKG
ncbi:MAG: cupin domain-containing protein [Gaiellaceae bacterium]